MSHSIPRRTRNGASALVGRRDLLALAADVVGGEPAARRRRPACGRRSPGTRSRGRERARPISSTLARPSDQVVWQCRSPRMSLDLDQRAAARRGTAPRAARAGTTGSPSARVDRGLVGRRRAAARAPRRTPAEPVARTSSVPKRSGAATTSSTGTPSTVTPTRAALAALDHRDDLRQRARSAPAPASGRGAARRRRAARRSRASAAHRRPARRRARARSPPTSSRARVEQQARGGGPRAPAPAPRAIRASIFGPMPGHVAQPPRRDRLAELLRRAGRPARARSPATRRALSPR